MAEAKKHISRRILRADLPVENFRLPDGASGHFLDPEFGVWVHPEQVLLRRRLSSEERLMLAVLEMALSDVGAFDERNRRLVRRGCPDPTQRHRTDALRWFWSRANGSPFSFARICAHFGWQHEPLRHAVLRLVTR